MQAQSDATLHALLDDLCAPSPAYSPSSGALLATDAQSTFDRASIPDALASANAALAAAGLPTRLPLLPDSSAASAHIALVTTLGTIAQLARGCEASARLRKDAEAKVDRVHSDARAHEEDSKKQKAKAEEAEAKVNDMRRLAARATRRAREDRLVLEKESEDLRCKLAAVVRREGVLVFEGRRRDKELAKLQARVHDMLANRDAVRPPVVTFVAGTEAAYAHDGEFRGEVTAYKEAEKWPRLVDASYEERHEYLVEEGKVMRRYVGLRLSSHSAVTIAF